MVQVGVLIRRRRLSFEACTPLWNGLGATSLLDAAVRFGAGLDVQGCSGLIDHLLGVMGTLCAPMLRDTLRWRAISKTLLVHDGDARGFSQGWTRGRAAIIWRNGVARKLLRLQLTVVLGISLGLRAEVATLASCFYCFHGLLRVRLQ